MHVMLCYLRTVVSLVSYIPTAEHEARDLTYRAEERDSVTFCCSNFGSVLSFLHVTVTATEEREREREAPFVAV